MTEHEESWSAVEREETEPARPATEQSTEAGEEPEVMMPDEPAYVATEPAAPVEAEPEAPAEQEAEQPSGDAAELAKGAGPAEPLPVEAEPAEPAGAAEPLPAEAESAESAEQLKKRWYVIHTYSGHENKVRANLERAIQYARMQERFGEILVATEDYAVMKAGKKQITKRKTFPSYVLVEMAMDDESRALVQNIPGVTHFVGDKRPTALTEAEVRRIRGEEVREVGKVTTEVPFKVGESVKVTQGPFADFVGSVDEINLERGKLRVMVSIFGRATAVELDLTHVTSI